MGVDVDTTIGALLIGFGVSAVFYGVFLTQVYTYCWRYPSDKVGYKVVVASILLLETAHQALVGHAVYYYSVTNFMNMTALFGKPIWSLVFQLLVGAVTGTIVKLLFAIRVWRFSHGNVWLTMILLLLALAQLGLAIDYTLKSNTLSALSDLVSLRVLGMIALGIGVLNDMGIAISLCYYLQAMRCKFENNSLIRTLTLYAVNTGVLTSAMSFSTLMIYNCMPKNLVFVGFFFALSKLYAVSFVAALNTRQTIQGQGVNEESRKSTAFPATAPEQTQRSASIPIQIPPGDSAWMPDAYDTQQQSEPHYVMAL